MQGQAAESEVSSALGAAGRLSVDCTVLVRGGGSRSDLAAFDSRTISEAVARSAVPVITGLGHEIDSAIADRVAHTSTKTPTQAAEFLVQRVRSAEMSVLQVAQGLRAASDALLREAGARPTRVTTVFYGAVRGMELFDPVVDNLAGVLAGAAERLEEERVLERPAIEQALAELDEWRHQSGATVWYSLPLAEGVRP